MDKLTRKEVEHIAGLANIQLTEEEVGLFQEQLTSVIEYNIKLLSEVDVRNVSPTAQTTGLQNVWRVDEVQSSLSQDSALSQSPAHEQGQFKVKRVMGES